MLDLFDERKKADSSLNSVHKQKVKTNPFKKLLSITLVLLLIVGSFGLGQLNVKANEEGRTLKVLGIGNSFTVDGMQHIYQLSLDAGAEDMVFGILNIGGSDLTTHWNNAQNDSPAYDYQKNTSGAWVSRHGTTIEYGITDEDWDLIVIQQVSGKSGLPETYNSDIDNLIDFIQDNKTNDDARIGWQMTWAYQQDSNHGDFPRYDSDQMTMYNAIVSAVQQNIVPNDEIDLIIPSGTAVQNVRTSFIGDTLTRDGYHLSLTLGRYISSMTWLQAITGWSMDDIVYVPSVEDIPPYYLPVIKEAVYNAIETPFEVTQSSFTEEPEEANPDRNLDWEPDGLGYWNSGDGSYDENPEINRDADNSKFYIPSGRRFTEDDLPVGTVLIIDSGYQYRPDGWAADGEPAPGRPDNITDHHFVIDEDFWDGYEYRAFNIAAEGNDTDLTGQEEEVADKFRIRLPDMTANTIDRFTIDRMLGLITGNIITVFADAGTDLTNLTPEIRLNGRATISPASGEAQDSTEPVRYTVTAQNGAEQEYIVLVKHRDELIDTSKGYVLFDWEPAGLGYYNSGDGSYDPNPEINSTAGNSINFIASGRRFTIEDIPVGSVIEIEPGYQYRPEGWGYEGEPAPGRPNNITQEQLVVTEEFWENYEYRAFNVAQAGNSADLTGREDEVAEYLRIFIPEDEVAGEENDTEDPNATEDETDLAAENNNLTLYIIGGIVVLALIAAGVYLYSKKQKDGNDKK